MGSLRNYSILIFITILIIGCSSSPSSYSKEVPITYKEIRVETPNCPSSECKFRYENSDRNDYVNPPGKVLFPQSNSTLFAICYERSGGVQERVVVPPNTTTLKHPLDCMQPSKEEEVVLEDLEEKKELEPIEETDTLDDQSISEYDQDLLDQLLELFEQGLISVTTYEKEKDIILNNQN